LSGEGIVVIYGFEISIPEAGVTLRDLAAASMIAERETGMLNTWSAVSILLSRTRLTTTRMDPRDAIEAFV